MGTLMIYIGALLPLIWGISHLIPTKNVVKGFGEISIDNRHIITMEWIVEGVALIFVGVLVIIVTFLEPTNLISIVIYITVACFLIAMAVISLFTGFRIDFLPFRLCPVIFSASAVLITIGWLLIL